MGKEEENEISSKGRKTSNYLYILSTKERTCHQQGREEEKNDKDPPPFDSRKEKGEKPAEHSHKGPKRENPGRQRDFRVFPKGRKESKKKESKFFTIKLKRK